LFPQLVENLYYFAAEKPPRERMIAVRNSNLGERLESLSCPVIIDRGLYPLRQGCPSVFKRGPNLIT